MKKQDWDNIQEATEFERPTPGGYIVRVTGVDDVEDKEYLMISYDFADGGFKGYYAELFDAKGFWGGRFVRSYKPKALPFFKGFKTCLEASNRGYLFDEDNLAAMRGKLLGVVLGEEEYRKNDGGIGTRLYVNRVCTTKAIQTGDFEVPALKRLTVPGSASPSYSAPANYAPLSDDDGELPF